jgi:hypothetical protein
MGKDEIAAFLNHLAVREQVSASTQNQAFHALLFLYKRVLEIDLGEIPELVRARRSRYLPVVLTRDPHCAGAARAQPREHDHDLHARAEPRRQGRAEPPGSGLNQPGRFLLFRGRERER